MDLHELPASVDPVKKKSMFIKQLIKAVSSKNHEELKLLLSKANFDDINTRLKESALDIAASLGDPIAVKLLLAHGAISDYKRPIHFWTTSTLSRAIGSGNLEVIQLLVNHGCNPDTKVIAYLNQYFFNNTCVYNYWFIIIHLQNLPIFKLLLNCVGRQVLNDEWSRQMLFTAISLGSNAIVEYLLDKGVSIESVDENGWTCLFYAVDFRRISILHLLIERGANIKKIDSKGCNLLHIAVNNYMYVSEYLTNSVEIAQLLINHGVDINATNNKGLTPINLACTMMLVNKRLIMLLLRRPNINLAQPDVEGVTVLHRAVLWENLKFLQFILCKSDVDVNSRDNKGITPLQYNTNWKSFNCFYLLLEYGADVKVLMNELRDDSLLFSLSYYQLMRKIANFSDNLDINHFLAQYPDSLKHFRDEYISMLTDEIESMKESILCNELTYYDFLHAKRRTCMKVARRPEMQAILLNNKHKFYLYRNTLEKNCLIGMRPLTAMESKAIDSVEENLNVIFNYNLPNLVVYNIKKYLDVEDIEILEKIKLYRLGNNKSEKSVNLE